ncbi:MAG: prolyl oligopeptidase family serine peptidase [Bacteroidales bacterium]|nr:prolyl oligopeptidase family serine peptidase [Bacteroidales bacterium]MCF8390803.1 prolyl oligopeptidase family serine peptidase [Bacteroidales bacterium]
MKKFSLLFVLLHIFIFLSAQNKIPLDHSVYEDWKDLKNIQISNNGDYLLFEINPQLGDGNLYIREVNSENEFKIPRAYDAKITEDSRFVVGKIKPQLEITLSAKRQKKSVDEQPKDSLFVYDLKNNILKKYEKIRSFMIPEKSSNWIVYHTAYEKSKDDEEKDGNKKDNKKTDKKFSKIASKNKLSDLTILNPESGKSYSYENVSGYSLNKNGQRVLFHQFAKDSIQRSVVYSFNTGDESLDIIFEGEGIVSSLNSDEQGKQSAFLFTNDTLRISGLDLYYWTPGTKASVKLIDSLGIGLQDSWGINKHGGIYFSESGDRLYFGSSEIPEIQPKDTLLKEEKSSVDVWNWHDEYLQPMQLKRLKDEQKRSYLGYYSIGSEKFIQLADPVVKDVETMHKGNGDIAIGFASDQYGKSLSWEGIRYRDVYTIDMNTGDKELVLLKLSGTKELSPFGNYIIYYVSEDSAWFCYNIKGKQTVNLSSSLEVNFYNEENDMPQLPGNYGYIGFSEGDEYVLIYDRYDVWKFDPNGKKSPVCLTNSYGRENKVRLRYVRLQKDEYYIDLQKKLYFTFANEINKDEGIAELNSKNSSEIRILTSSGNDYHSLIKAKDAEVFAYRKGNFQDYADIYLTDSKFKLNKKVSATNPQSDNYLWGDVKLVSWISFNGDKLDGLLYTPEKIDLTKKYPMLVYFYEKNSDGIHNHRIPSPSRSTINIPWCTSNDYVVFVPDIVYRDGYPGESAYDAIVSGTVAMTENNSFIDKDRIGIQGQSWGGYQVAYLVTQTNIYAAAMAGAPVSNMTSAYGGIRWESGMSRMFQYEHSQSRIGGTLWEKPLLYIENSPLFQAPRVETPLLMMHNDSDGAVPWYQGIEFFVALRRLDKPVWMLSYNNEEHNLTKWPNRIDLGIRMMQFFDYYLKDAPEPKWMSEGVPAMEKGKVNGRELLK